MGETPEQIEAHIDQTRMRLGGNFRELQQRVDDALDWREQFRNRPYTLLGAAAIGGVLLASALGRRSPRPHTAAAREPLRGAVSRGGVTVSAQALEAWDNIKMALIGVATARVHQYLSELVPGYQNHLPRTAAATGAGEPGAAARTGFGG
jgi:hypothetical protein